MLVTSTANAPSIKSPLQPVQLQQVEARLMSCQLSCIENAYKQREFIWIDPNLQLKQLSWWQGVFISMAKLFNWHQPLMRYFAGEDELKKMMGKLHSRVSLLTAYRPRLDEQYKRVCTIFYQMFGCDPLLIVDAAKSENLFIGATNPSTLSAPQPLNLSALYRGSSEWELKSHPSAYPIRSSLELDQEEASQDRESLVKLVHRINRQVDGVEYGLKPAVAVSVETSLPGAAVDPSMAGPVGVQLELPTVDGASFDDREGSASLLLPHLSPVSSPVSSPISCSGSYSGSYSRPLPGPSPGPLLSRSAAKATLMPQFIERGTISNYCQRSSEISASDLTPASPIASYQLGIEVELERSVSRDPLSVKVADEELCNLPKPPALNSLDLMDQPKGDLKTSRSLNRSSSASLGKNSLEKAVRLKPSKRAAISGGGDGVPPDPLVADLLVADPLADSLADSLIADSGSVDPEIEVSESLDLAVATHPVQDIDLDGVDGLRALRESKKERDASASVLGAPSLIPLPISRGVKATSPAGDWPGPLAVPFAGLLVGVLDEKSPRNSSSTVSSHGVRERSRRERNWSESGESVASESSDLSSIVDAQDQVSSLMQIEGDKTADLLPQHLFQADPSQVICRALQGDLTALQIIKPQHGMVGVTRLFPQLHLVLKVCFRFNAEQEICNGELMQHYGMNVPQVRALDMKAKEMLQSSLPDFKPGLSGILQFLSAVDSNCEVIAAPLISGITMGSLFLDGKKLESTAGHWSKWIEEMGYITFFDLILGHNDRLIQVSSYDPCTPRFNQMINADNLMVDLSPSGEICSMTPIDNGSVLVEKQLDQSEEWMEAFTHKITHLDEIANYVIDGLCRHRDSAACLENEPERMARFLLSMGLGSRKEFFDLIQQGFTRARAVFMDKALQGELLVDQICQRDLLPSTRKAMQMTKERMEWLRNYQQEIEKSLSVDSLDAIGTA